MNQTLLQIRMDSTVVPIVQIVLIIPMEHTEAVSVPKGHEIGLRQEAQNFLDPMDNFSVI